MPIKCQYELTPLDRTAFGRITYDLYSDVLSIREELGRFFDEKHYKQALALMRNDLALEVPILVTHKHFNKTYYLDVLLAGGGVVEFKATTQKSPSHKAQLLHYLMLTGLSCGLLINVRPERVSHEYVNNALLPHERHQFEFSLIQLDPPTATVEPFIRLLEDLLNDWGTGLALSLYEEALTFLLGGEKQVIRPVSVTFRQSSLGVQTMRFAAPRIAFKLTAFESDGQKEGFSKHGGKLVQHLDIDSLLWVNLARHQVTIRLLHKQK